MRLCMKKSRVGLGIKLEAGEEGHGEDPGGGGGVHGERFRAGPVDVVVGVGETTPSQRRSRSRRVVRSSPSKPASEAPAARGKLSIVPFALPAYQPETDWMLGGAAALVHQPGDGGGSRESSLLLAGAASVRGQFSLMLQPEWFLAGDDLQLKGLIGAELFPDQFYGIGGATRLVDEEPNTARFLELSANPCWRIASSLYFGPLVRWQRARMTEVAPGGLLAQGSIPGSSGGDTVELGALAAWDTRDSALYPRSGALVRLSLHSALPVLGSSFEFQAFKLDARGYLTLPWRRHVLAVQAMLELRGGEPPFYDLGRLGGPMAMRGYFAGRYRDRQLATAQVEYRAPLPWRFGAVAFVSAGNVAREPAGLVGAVKPAGGAGLRWAPIEGVPINVSLDLAYGSEATVYLRLAEAF